MTALQHHLPAGRVLTDLSHGETAEPGGLATPDGEELELAEVSTPFDYLFAALTNDPEAHLPAGDPTTTAKVVADLKALGKLMTEPRPVSEDPFQSNDGNSTVPAIYTYLGQFIDHDITARTDRRNEVGHVIDDPLQPADPATVRATVRNERVPALDLDSVYGDGPTFPRGSGDRGQGHLRRDQAQDRADRAAGQGGTGPHYPRRPHPAAGRPGP